METGPQLYNFKKIYLHIYISYGAVYQRTYIKFKNKTLKAKNLLYF